MSMILYLKKWKLSKDPSAFSIYHVIGEGETEVKTTSDGVKDFLHQIGIKRIN